MAEIQTHVMITCSRALLRGEETKPCQIVGFRGQEGPGCRARSDPLGRIVSNSHGLANVLPTRILYSRARLQMAPGEPPDAQEPGLDRGSPYAPTGPYGLRPKNSFG